MTMIRGSEEHHNKILNMHVYLPPIRSRAAGMLGRDTGREQEREILSDLPMPFFDCPAVMQ